MTVNEFIKLMRKSFSDVEYRATSKDGQVFKSQGWDKANDRIQARINRKNKFDKKF